MHHHCFTCLYQQWPPQNAITLQQNSEYVIICSGEYAILVSIDDPSPEGNLLFNECGTRRSDTYIHHFSPSICYLPHKGFVIYYKTINSPRSRTLPKKSTPLFQCCFCSNQAVGRTGNVYQEECAKQNKKNVYTISQVTTCMSARHHYAFCSFRNSFFIFKRRDTVYGSSEIKIKKRVLQERIN